MVLGPVLGVAILIARAVHLGGGAGAQSGAVDAADQFIDDDRRSRGPPQPQARRQRLRKAAGRRSDIVA